MQGKVGKGTYYVNGSQTSHKDKKYSYKSLTKRQKQNN